MRVMKLFAIAGVALLVQGCKEEAQEAPAAPASAAAAPAESAAPAAAPSAAPEEPAAEPEAADEPEADEDENADQEGDEPEEKQKKGKKKKVKIANAKSIARYGDEKKLKRPKKSKLLRLTSVLGEATNDGEVLGVLEVDTKVQKIAKRKKHFLITFKDPEKKKRTLMGWVDKKSFKKLSAKEIKAKEKAEKAAEKSAEPKTLVCKKGLTPFVGAQKQFCAAVCVPRFKGDTDELLPSPECGATQACFGVAPVSNAGKPGNVKRFCSSLRQDSKEEEVEVVDEDDDK